MKSADADELFEHIVTSSTDFAIFTIAPDGVATSWNLGAERVFGFSAEEILGSSGDVIFTAEDRAAGVPEGERQEALRSGRAEDERWHLRRDGSLFWASGALMPLRDRSEGFVKIVRDRTERHRAHEVLEESEERFRVLATSIPQLVFRTRPDGDRTWGSPQWIEFTGLSPAESAGFGWPDAIHPEDLAATERGWGEAQGSGEYHVEHRVRRAADGEYLWHQTRARPVQDGAGATGDWVGTMTDVHDLRTMRDQQQVLLAELQHRTRNLLAVVQSVARQTRESSNSLEGFGSEFESRLRALGRVQSLLARMDHGDIDLRELVQAELEAHADGALNTGKVTIEGLPVALPSAAAQTLGLAVHELATNALKYGALAQPEGRLAVTWTVEGDAAKPRVVLEWREGGVRMPEGGQPRRKGYGSELIERALPYQLRAKTRLEFGPDGVRCTIIAPIGRKRADGSHG